MLDKLQALEDKYLDLEAKISDPSIQVIHPLVLPVRLME